MNGQIIKTSETKSSTEQNNERNKLTLTPAMKNVLDRLFNNGTNNRHSSVAPERRLGGDTSKQRSPLKFSQENNVYTTMSPYRSSMFARPQQPAGLRSKVLHSDLSTHYTDGNAPQEYLTKKATYF